MPLASLYDTSPLPPPFVPTQRLLLHLIRLAPWYPALGDLLLQSRNLSQTLRLSYEFLDAPLLFVCKLYAVALVTAGEGAVCRSGGGGDVEGAGFDAHYL